MEILKKETYLKMLENSIGNKLFNSIIIKNENGEVKDLLNDGEYSCALFVSGILYLNMMTGRTRTTVNNLEKDLSENQSFVLIEDQTQIQPGDILIWESVTYEDGSQNRHVGFAISKDGAVSTDYLKKHVTEHPINKDVESTGLPRKIERVLRFVF